MRAEDRGGVGGGGVAQGDDAHCEQMDANGDGEISQIEFIKALRQHPELADKLELPSSIHQVHAHAAHEHSTHTRAHTDTCIRPRSRRTRALALAHVCMRARVCVPRTLTHTVRARAGKRLS